MWTKLPVSASTVRQCRGPTSLEQSNPANALSNREEDGSVLEAVQRKTNGQVASDGGSPRVP